jgi:hypothetical protein
MDERIDNNDLSAPADAGSTSTVGTAVPPEHAEWDETWQSKLSQVDDKLVEFFHDAGEKAGDLAEQAKDKVQDWFDHTDMDEKARANWEKAKSDGKVFSSQVNQRITHLVENGKIKWAEWTKKRDEPA